MTSDDFVRLHGAKHFRHSQELLSSISGDKCTLGVSGHVALQDCRHFLGIYRGRAKHLKKFDTPHAISLREDTEALCRELERTPEEKVRSWLYASAERTFWVFEGNETHRILGCIYGVDKRKVSEIEWKELWGE